jgi:hypothetical protein
MARPGRTSFSASVASSRRRPVSCRRRRARDRPRSRRRRKGARRRPGTAHRSPPPSPRPQCPASEPHHRPWRLTSPRAPPTGVVSGAFELRSTRSRAARLESRTTSLTTARGSRDNRWSTSARAPPSPRLASRSSIPALPLGPWAPGRRRSQTATGPAHVRLGGSLPDVRHRDAELLRPMSPFAPPRARAEEICDEPQSLRPTLSGGRLKGGIRLHRSRDGRTLHESRRRPETSVLDPSATWSISLIRSATSRDATASIETPH